MLKSLWGLVQGDPVFMRKLNGWAVWFWLAMIPVSVVTGWISMVPFLGAISIYAIVTGHWATWGTARIEVKQAAAEAELKRHPVEKRVVEEIVAKTDVSDA